VKLIYDKAQQQYQWQLDQSISSPKFFNESDAQVWYKTVMNYFTDSQTNKKTLPKLLTKF